MKPHSKLRYRRTHAAAVAVATAAAAVASVVGAALLALRPVQLPGLQEAPLNLMPGRRQPAEIRAELDQTIADKHAALVETRAEAERQRRVADLLRVRGNSVGETAAQARRERLLRTERALRRELDELLLSSARLDTSDAASQKRVSNSVPWEELIREARIVSGDAGLPDHAWDGVDETR